MLFRGVLISYLKFPRTLRSVASGLTAGDEVLSLRERDLLGDGDHLCTFFRWKASDAHETGIGMI